MKEVSIERKKGGKKKALLLVLLKSRGRGTLPWTRPMFLRGAAIRGANIM